jgi:hypothetical protein
MAHRLSVLAAAVVVGVLSGCASGPAFDAAQPTASEGEVLIQVEHNAQSASALAIHIVDHSGIRHRLGVVAPGQVETFGLGGIILAGRYTLLAEAADGRTLQSRPFSLVRRDGVRWDVHVNRVVPWSRRR